MYKMRESWTDERLDDFRDEVNRRFDKVDAELHDLRSSTESGMRGLNERFDSLQRTLLQIAGGTIATLIAGIVAIVVTQL
jgi:hypothetical protein